MKQKMKLYLIWSNLLILALWSSSVGEHLFTFKVFKADRAASRAGMASANSLSHSSFRDWASLALIVAASSSTRTTLLLASTSTDSTSITWKISHEANTLGDKYLTEKQRQETLYTYLHHVGVLDFGLFKFGLQVYKFLLHLTNLRTIKSTMKDQCPHLIVAITKLCMS